MSLLFDGEQVPGPAAAPAEPTPEEYDAALDDLRQKKSTSLAGSRLRSFERAEELYRVAREVEPLLLRAIADGTVDTGPKAVTFIRDRAPAWFPAAKMVAIMLARAGGTPALLRAAAIREVGRAEK